jgi:hypothetical protein
MMGWGSTNPDSFRAQISNLLNALSAKGHTGFTGDYVWWPPADDPDRNAETAPLAVPSEISELAEMSSSMAINGRIGNLSQSALIGNHTNRNQSRCRFRGQGAEWRAAWMHSIAPAALPKAVAISLLGQSGPPLSCQ